MVNDPQELMLDLLRAIRADITGMNRRLDTLQTDVLNVRKDLHKLGGDLLRQEENFAHLGTQVDRINARLGLVDA